MILSRLCQFLGLLAVGLAVSIGAAQAQGGKSAGWEMRVCADPDRMPFTHSDETGFENRIAKILAEEMGARLTFEWFPQSPLMFSENLRTGKCDIVMGVQDGQATLMSTIAYFRSPYVFVQKADKPHKIEMFDDPALADLRIGVQDAIGPTHDALRSRGLAPKIKEFYDFSLTDGVKDVAEGNVDVAILWGPAAGYYAARQNPPLLVLPVTPEFEPPFTPMFINIAIGLRRGEEELQKIIDFALAKRWTEINAILAEYNIPMMELQRPLLSIEGR